MDTILFQHTKSRRVIALQMLLWAVLFPAIPAAFLHFSGHGEVLQREPDPKILIGFGLVVLGLVATAAWNFFNPATFRFVVTPSRVICEYPGNGPWSFDLPVQEVVALEHQASTNHAGRNDKGHFLILKDGTEQHVTMNYFNPVNKIQKALLQANPRIEIRSKRDHKIL